MHAQSAGGPNLRNELQLQATCTENFAKFGHMAFQITKQTDTQTNTDRNAKI